MSAKQTVEAVSQNLRGEEQRLATLMADYAQTLQMLEAETRRTTPANPDRYRVFIPEQKRDLVQPVVDEIISRVFNKIDEQAQDAAEARKAIERL